MDTGISNDANDLNWREHILEALKNGHVTTIISFNETKYLITLQPYIAPPNLGAHRRTICAMCGQVIVLELTPPTDGSVHQWYHQDPKHGSHAAQPIHERPGPEAAAATPVVGARDVCAMCDKPIVYVNPFWQHEGLLSPRHPAVPKSYTPEVVVTAEKAWAGARCVVCNRGIGYDGTRWLHLENTYLDHEAQVPEGVGPKITPPAIE